MRRKSKFLAFILSFIPGLGQIYLGFSARGAIFLLACFGVTFISFFLKGFPSLYSPELLAFFGVPIIWFISMVDSMILADRINMKFYNQPYQPNQYNNENTQNLYNEYSVPQPSLEDINKQNKKILALVLSIIPGVGHLYLGLQKQGIELMAAFFLSFFLSDWIRFSAFLIFVPIIWFYSLFDVFHKVSGNRDMTDDDILSITDILGNSSFIRNKGRVFGYGLIIIGILVILNRVVFPNIELFLSYSIRNDIQTTLVAIILIFGGIKLINMNRKKLVEASESDK